MKQIHTLIIAFFCLLGAASCNDGLDRPGGGILEGKVRIGLTRSSGPLVTSRAADNSKDETIENVAVFVFDKSGNVSESFTQSSSEDIRYIDVFMEADDDAVYVVANHPAAQALIAEIKTLADLKSRSLRIESASGAYPGKYVMTGSESVANLAGMGSSKEIRINRMAAHLSFKIRVDTTPKQQDGGQGGLVGDGGEFKISAAYLCQVPRGGYLFGQPDVVSVESHEGDFVYDPDPDVMRGNYFESVRLATREDADGSTVASFDIFENRRGGMDRSDGGNWPELADVKEHALYEVFKQTYKRTRAMDYPNHIGSIKFDKKDQNEVLYRRPEVREGQFYNATYLRIDGIYKKPGDVSTYNTSYYVYLGHDEVADYNIRRNHWYDNEIVIRSYDDFDFRVTGEGLDGLTVHAPDPEPLDAHCNVVKVLMYSENDWTVSVDNPDDTPWLEVSHSGDYKPRLHGVTPTGGEAAFSISGKKGLNYFYIHTDEYIPDIDRVEQNLGLKNRHGKVICRSGKEMKEIPVEQMPAQLVVLDLRDHLLFSDVYYSFFIERKLEQKYIPWGYFYYWCWALDKQIGSNDGQWDGMGNTIVLNSVGTEGDYNEILDERVDPAYPDGLPYDHAIGYIMAKNRDRNGNGKIDEEEIVWYWPSTKELEAVYTAKRRGMIDFEGKSEAFHSSQPSAADPIGVTPGFSYIVRMSDGKHHVEQRDRKYNVLGCRLKNRSGGATGTGGGNVTTDPNWEEGEEVIIPRMK